MSIKHFRILLFVAICFLTVSACGKKGPPMFVAQKLEIRVEHLSATLEDGRIHFQGTVINTGDLTEKDFSNMGCKVFLALYPLEDPPCEGCPLEYKLCEKVKGPVISKENFSWFMPLEKKTGIYFFKVALSGPDGEAGPFSEPAKLNIEE